MPSVDEPSRAAIALALTVTLTRFDRSPARSRATMVVAILVVLACGTVSCGFSPYSSCPEASSTIATYQAETLGGAASPVLCGTSAGCVLGRADGVATHGGMPLGSTA